MTLDVKTLATSTCQINEEIIRLTLSRRLSGFQEMTAVGLVTVGKRNVYSENGMYEVQSVFTLLRNEPSSLQAPQLVKFHLPFNSATPSHHTALHEPPLSANTLRQTVRPSHHHPMWIRLIQQPILWEFGKREGAPMFQSQVLLKHTCYSGRSVRLTLTSFYCRG
jgi:hypothetical protein